MSKKNKKNKKNKKFNPIFEMLMKEEAAEREDVAAEKKQVKAGKDSTPVISIKQVKAGTESVCTSKKEAAEKVDVAAANESSDNEKKKEVAAAAPKEEKEIKLSDTDAAKCIKEFFHTA